MSREKHAVEVFISYARADGEVEAAELIEHLRRDAPDFGVKQDHNLLEGGINWWIQITKAIDSSHFLILVLTPAAIQSPNVEKEWRYARQQGVCVYPVKAAPDSELHFDKMPRWMSKAHFFDLDKEWPTFLAHLRKGCDKRRVPFMAPDLPPHFVERPAEFEALKNLLLNPGRTEPVAITTALTGAGGFGKTTLAAALCHDPDIIEHFDDGILWVTLGQTPNVLSSLLTAHSALVGEPPSHTSIESVAYELGQMLEQRTCLLVIDDVWDRDHLQPFLRGSKSSARLFTTRDASIAAEDGTPVTVDEMREQEAISMLTTGSNLETTEARDLSRRLGEWPLALELAASMIRERVRLGEAASKAAGHVLRALERKGAAALKNPDRTISSVLELSLSRLDPADRRRLAELSIFPEDVPIPLAAAAAIWELDEFDSEDLAQQFARLSLLKLNLQIAVLTLHDVMRSWLAGRITNAKDIHNRLLGAWPDWQNLPNLPGEYAWRWLPWHLSKGERKKDIEQILWNPRWMLSKLKATDVNALIADYEHLKPSPEADLVQSALRLSANVLTADAAQFPCQMVGRLLPHQSSPPVIKLIAETTAAASKPWLRPLHPALHPPGTELIRTLEGHSDLVNGVAVTPDGRRAVSASRDNTLKVWDLDSGRPLQTLEGHSKSVNGVAVTPDGGRAVSASDDNTLKVWDLSSGRVLQTLEGHSDLVYGVAVTPDGRRAVSASRDNTLKVWDLDSGRPLQTLEGHSKSVNAVAVTPDGGRAVSASDDNTLKVWDLGSGRVLQTLEGHSYGVAGVAVTPDCRAVSASHDKTLKVWDLDSGRALQTLEVHSSGVTVAVTPDGRRAVSASDDNTLKVWDLDSGRALQTLEGHSSYVNDVAVTPDGRRAVSASYDYTLKVWDLDSGRARQTLEGHSSYVNGVAVTPNGRRAVSASWDTTLKTWDLDSGRSLQTLAGHSNWVTGVAVAPGRRAVSASWDTTLKAWDLDSGRALQTLEGHSSYVNDVAVTPDGRRAVSASRDTTLKVWDLNSGRPLQTLEGHSMSVNDVAVTPDGRHAVSASDDNTLKFWDLDSGRALQTLEGHSKSVTGVAVTPDGRHAVSASGDNTLKTWDLDSGRPHQTLAGHSDWVDGVAVTPDGRRAISASNDKTVRVWNLETGQPIATFHCDHTANCVACADNHTIVAGDGGGRVHFLRLEE